MSRITQNISTRAGPFVSAAALAAVWLIVAAPCMAALDCPKPQTANTLGVIRETPAQIHELAQVLASGDLGPQVPIVIKALRTRHSNVSSSSLVNYLVTAYCPVVKHQNGLTEAQRYERLSAFTASVVQAAY